MDSSKHLKQKKKKEIRLTNIRFGSKVVRKEFHLIDEVEKKDN